MPPHKEEEKTVDPDELSTTNTKLLKTTIFDKWSHISTGIYIQVLDEHVFFSGFWLIKSVIYIYIYIHHKLYILLVVLTILKNISQWEGLSDILWKTNAPNHQPDIVKCWSHEFPLPFILQFPSSDLWTLPNSSAAKWRVPRSRWWRWLRRLRYTRPERGRAPHLLMPFHGEYLVYSSPQFTCKNWDPMILSIINVGMCDFHLKLCRYMMVYDDLPLNLGILHV